MAKKIAPANATKEAPKEKGVRLGDDILPSAEREVSVVVANAEIVNGKASLRMEPVGIVRLRRGQILYVKHTYRLQEHSRDKEEYRFLLQARMDRQTPAPALARFGDVWGLPDDIMGALAVKFTAPAPGSYTLHFDVGVEYCVSGWNGDTVEKLDRQDLSGTLQIRVQD